MRAASIFALLFAPCAAFGYVTDQSAVAAAGQQSLTSSGVNGTQGVAASGLSNPGGVWSDGTMLIVADGANNRVLIYNTVPVANNTPADIVLGQPDFGSSSANQGGPPTANTMSNPTGVYFDGNGELYVADTGNNRVLIFASLPQANDTPADLVVGQPDLVSNSSNQGGSPNAATLSAPTGVFSDNAELYVADQGNNRVLIYTPIPSANAAAATVAVGQLSFTSGAANQGGVTPSSTTASRPSGVYMDGTKLYVADQGNNRVLIYNSTPTVSGVGADVVVGQIFFSSGAANQGQAKPSATGMSAPSYVYSNASQLIVSDSSNNRVLLYNSVPAANGAASNVAVGQVSLSTGAANQGGSSPAANTLSRPKGVAFDGTQLYVVDQGNNRALIYSVLPSSHNASAAVVVGQTNMTTGTSNQASTTAGAATLARPNAVWTDRTKLYVADRSNNRILIYNSVPTASNASADVVVGQVLMSSGSANQGGAVSTNTLSFPTDVYSDGSRLFIADQVNNRVLIYNSIPASNNALASVVIGQASMTAGGFNQGKPVNANTLGLPASVRSDGTRLFVADQFNNRVLIYNSIPVSNNASANIALGQPNLASGALNQGGVVASTTLARPADAYYDGSKLYVADQSNNRVLIYNPPFVTNEAASVVVGQPDMKSSAANQGHGPTASTLSRPAGVYSDGTSLYIADQGNNRVLVYNPIPSSNGASAALAIGQASLTSGSANQGGSVSASTLFSPSDVMVDSTTGRMFVADSVSNRVLLYYPAISTGIGPNGGSLTLSEPIEPVLTQIQVPPGAFAQNINMTLSLLPSFPGGSSPAGALNASGIGVQVSLDQPVQPAQNVALYVSYNPADIAGLDPGKLILARNDASTNGSWVPLPSVSDTGNTRVIGQTGHFSLFQIMQGNPSGNSVSSARAYPNPLLPSQGETTMTFSSLPAGARLRFYTLYGTLVKDLSADATGIARWDGTNQAGASVASGVYFVLVQAQGQNRTMKVAVER